MKAKYCTPLQRREVIAAWLSSTPTDAIARIVGVSQLTVNDVVAAYKLQLRHSEPRYTMRTDIKPVDYSSHDKANRHYAGCEFEDTRPPHLRGLDWPIKVYL